MTASLAHRNCRAAAWWNMREMLDPAAGLELALPPDDKLTGDLVSPKKREVSGSRIRVEEKTEIIKRLQRSPDDGDAVVMAFWAAAGGISWADLYEEIAAMERGEDAEKTARARAVQEGEPEPKPAPKGTAPPVLQPKPKPRSGGGWASIYAPPEKPAPGQPPPRMPPPWGR